MHNPSSGSVAALLLTCFLFVAAALPAADAATPGGPAPDSVTGKRTGIPKQRVPERYISTENPGEELDSLATWRHPDGTVWLIATAKSKHRLVVFDADSGQRLRDFGEKGEGVGQFRRPNGIAVLDNRLFVVERDNRRVQVFALPDFRPLGSFGQSDLRAPYGLWLHPRAGGVDVYITDNFMLGERFDVVPPLEQLDLRVRRYHLTFGRHGEVFAEPRGHFGDTSEANALRVVESIAGDPAHDRLLIADENQPHSTLREYTLAGRATGRRIPDDTFAFEAEGVALWSCGKRGYWVAVDQLSPRTVFHVFDRRTLSRVGSITGNTVARTDGIALRTAPSAHFPKGALYAVHADTSVAAFDLRDIAATLNLARDCR